MASDNSGDSSSLTEREWNEGPLVFMRWEPGSESIYRKPRKIPVTEILDTKVLALEGTHVFFFPRITDIQTNIELSKELARVFHIDPFFLTQSAYESNGFFHVNESPIPGYESYSSSSRFLVKEIWKPTEASGTLVHRIRFAQEKKIKHIMSEIISVSDKAPEMLLQDICKIPNDKGGIIPLAKSAVEANKSGASFNNIVRDFENSLSTRSPQTDPKPFDKLSELIISRIHENECIMKDLRTNQNKDTETKRGAAHNSAVYTQRGRRTSRPAALDQSIRQDGGDPTMYMYHWLYLSFFTLWFESKSPNGKKTTQIILCFDDAHGKRVEDAIQEAVGLDSYPELDCPYGIIRRIVEAVTRIYDDALWTFRAPVRQIEKDRAEFSRNIKQAIELSAHEEAHKKSNNADKDGIINFYAKMHEIARHVIHIQETIQAAKNTMGEIADSRDHYHEGKDCGKKGWIKYWALIVANLKLRAESFNERVQNEISLAYNIVHAQQLGEAHLLLEESRRDGKDIAWMVGFLSMIFLPGTFVSGFFSMTFFGFVPDALAWHHSSNLWIYFAITVPLTLIGLVTFWRRHSQRGTIH